LLSFKHSSSLPYIQSIETSDKKNMKTVVKLLVFLCAIKGIVFAVQERRKCGIPTEKCQIMTNGKVFWAKDYDNPCPLAPICPPGYKLHKTRLGSLRACCCRYKNLQDCPDCDMTLAKKQSFGDWIDMHLKREGPPEGLCSNGKLKRVFIPNVAGQKDKCCCEPKTSPFIFALET
jgi:hypothetical protein